ncbi:hypothetical protein VTO42DRAFT_3594 [Malbranchea cinnamomea]
MGESGSSVRTLEVGWFFFFGLSARSWWLEKIKFRDDRDGGNYFFLAVATLVLIVPNEFWYIGPYSLPYLYGA